MESQLGIGVDIRACLGHSGRDGQNYVYITEARTRVRGHCVSVLVCVCVCVASTHSSSFQLLSSQETLQKKTDKDAAHQLALTHTVTRVHGWTHTRLQMAVKADRILLASGDDVEVRCGRREQENREGERGRDPNGLQGKAAAPLMRPNWSTTPSSHTTWRNRTQGPGEY